MKSRPSSRLHAIHAIRALWMQGLTMAKAAVALLLAVLAASACAARAQTPITGELLSEAGIVPDVIRRVGCCGLCINCPVEVAEP